MKNLHPLRKINKSFDSELRIEKQFPTIRRRWINEDEITSATKSVVYGALYFPQRDKLRGRQGGEEEQSFGAKVLCFMIIRSSCTINSFVHNNSSNKKNRRARDPLDPIRSSGRRSFHPISMAQPSSGSETPKLYLVCVCVSPKTLPFIIQSRGAHSNLSIKIQFQCVPCGGGWTVGLSI